MTAVSNRDRTQIQAEVGKAPVEAPYLSGRWPSGQAVEATINRDNFLVGRHVDADLIVPQDAVYVSSRHFEVQRTPVGYALVDLSSTNGTYLNNERIPPMSAHPLKNGDIIRVGSEQLSASIGLTFIDPSAPPAAANGFQTMLGATSLAQVERVKIGRDPACDIVLESPTVARVHAIIQKYDDSQHFIRATDSNRIQVNGRMVTQARLKAGDQVQIGPHLLSYDGNTLLRFDSYGYRLDVVDLYKEVKTKNGPLRILDDISLTIMPREFVALVGGSGAGKSTLLDALNGFRPAQGQVLINGQELYENYDAFRAQIGYVPQSEILPTSLTVDAALQYAARLRLAADLSAQERQERITKALATVEMNTERIRQTRIGRLSGGQRKRVSIAAELLADPKIFFLDEPASGLDPGLEKKLMVTLRKMADEGRTIVLITHATNNIVQADHVAFLSQGKLIYFGPAVEAQEYFEVDDFADIYEKSERHGEEWRQFFTRDNPEAYQKYVLERQERIAALPATRQERPSRTATLRQGLVQFMVLCQRMFRLTINDPIAMFVSLFVMPFVALQQLLVTEPHELVGDPNVLANPIQAAAAATQNYLPVPEAHTLAFSIAILAFLVGTFGGSQELIKERSIYLRERMVNLQLLPYIGSKFLVFGGFAMVQVLIYLAILSINLDLPADGLLLPGFIEIGITLFLTIMVGIATGLLISAATGNATVAVYLVLIVVFFQYIFGGAIHDLRDTPIEAQSYIAATRWTTLAVGTTLNINELAEATIVCGNKFSLDASGIVFDPASGTLDPNSLRLVETDESVCTNRAMSLDEIYLPYGNDSEDLLRFWGILGGMGAALALATLGLVKRLDYRKT